MLAISCYMEHCPNVLLHKYWVSARSVYHFTRSE